MIWLWLNLRPKEVWIRLKLGDVMVEEEGDECLETLRKAFRRWVSSDSVNSRRNFPSEDGFDGESVEVGSLVGSVDMVMEFGIFQGNGV